MFDPTGGAVAYWLYDSLQTESPPIVMLGSEGQLRIINDSLEGFLWQLARGITGEEDFDQNEFRDPAEFCGWLHDRAAMPEGQLAKQHPDLEAWIMDRGKLQRALIDTDPTLIEIADRLRKYVKPNAEVWETANFDVVLVGNCFEIRRRHRGESRLPKAEIRQLEPHFRAARERVALKNPERGLWLYAWTQVGSTGGAQLCREFLAKRQLYDEPLDIPFSDYELDFAAFPRSAHWTPEWRR